MTVKIIFSSVLILLLAAKCEHPDSATDLQDCCIGLSNLDRQTVQQCLQPVFDDMKASDSDTKRLNAILEYFKSLPCVGEIEVTPGDVETLPPQREILVKLRNPEKTIFVDIAKPEGKWYLSNIH